MFADHADADGTNSSPGLHGAARETALAVSTVGYALTTLRREGWLEKTHTGCRQLGFCDVYRLTVPTSVGQ